MCLKAPKITPAPTTPAPEDANVAADKALQKRAGAKGFGSTILGGALTPTPNATPMKTILGG